MIGSVGSSVLRLLRVLTPFEVVKLINELEIKKNEQRLLASEVVEEVVGILPATDTEFSSDMGQAKILSFNEVNTNGDEISRGPKKVISEGEQHDQFLINLGIKKKVKRSTKKVIGGEDFSEEDDDEPKQESISTTLFLLQEKAKLKKSQSRLFGQDALKIYKSQAALDTSSEDKEDLSQSSSTGILVNKRQF